MQDTPDKPIVRFDERQAGTPEAIHSWFYPGDNTGWEFVYPKGETLQNSANGTAAPVTVTAAAGLSILEPPHVEEAVLSPEEPSAVEEVVQDDPPAPAADTESALVPTRKVNFQGSADRMLPETAGVSGLQLMLGLAMLGGGLVAVSASLCKTLA